MTRQRFDKDGNMINTHKSKVPSTKKEPDSINGQRVRVKGTYRIGVIVSSSNSDYVIDLYGKVEHWDKNEINLLFKIEGKDGVIQERLPWLTANRLANTNNDSRFKASIYTINPDLK